MRLRVLGLGALGIGAVSASCFWDDGVTSGCLTYRDCPGGGSTDATTDHSSDGPTAMEAGDGSNIHDTGIGDAGAGDGGSDANPCLPPTSLECDGACVDPTELSHCGSCTTVCPPPIGGDGVATCTGSPPACGILCDAGFHACGGACTANTAALCK
jgi:hypothetical protein